MAHPRCRAAREHPRDRHRNEGHRPGPGIRLAPHRLRRGGSRRVGPAALAPADGCGHHARHRRPARGPVVRPLHGRERLASRVLGHAGRRGSLCRLRVDRLPERAAPPHGGSPCLRDVRGPRGRRRDARPPRAPDPRRRAPRDHGALHRPQGVHHAERAVGRGAGGERPERALHAHDGDHQEPEGNRDPVHRRRGDGDVGRSHRGRAARPPRVPRGARHAARRRPAPRGPARAGAPGDPHAGRHPHLHRRSWGTSAAPTASTTPRSATA